MSNYSGTMTENDWLYRLQQKVQAVNSDIAGGFDDYKKWYDFSYGKTMAQVGAALNITEAQATDMNVAFQVFKELNDALINVAVPASDRKTKLLKFV